MSIAERYPAAMRTLQAVGQSGGQSGGQSAGQSHVLDGFDRLDERRQLHLLDQIESIDWPEVTRLVRTHVLAKPKFALPQRVEPAPWYPYKPGTEKLKKKYAEARRAGEQLIREGKVAAFTVAGGQGTRLGWDAPKGTFPATPIRKTPLFVCFAEYLQKVREKYGRAVPWYIMTSPANDAATRDFFESNAYFGLKPEDVSLFPQAMLPAFDIVTGKALLEAPGSLALSPNGHGGSLKALHTSGALDDMKKRGVEQISYIQVDNPIVKVIDPLFLGLHALDGAQMSSKMLPKAFPKEKLGNICLIDGKVGVIEYSDLPDDLAEQRTADGELRFRAGSIAIHVLRVDFVESLNTAAEGFALPFHRAEKKVAHWDAGVGATGATIEPKKPNAVKLETFVFDALPLCEKSIVYETDRVEEFAPIKNADDPDPAKCVDSPVTSKAIQVERAARWLERHGVKVERDTNGATRAVIEISPCVAIEAADLAKVKLPARIAAGETVLI